MCYNFGRLFNHNKVSSGSFCDDHMFDPHRTNLNWGYPSIRKSGNSNNYRKATSAITPRTKTPASRIMALRDNFDENNAEVNNDDFDDNGYNTGDNSDNTDDNSYDFDDYADNTRQRRL